MTAGPRPTQVAVALFAYVAALPVMLADSGGPQVADVALVALAWSLRGSGGGQTLTSGLGPVVRLQVLFAVVASIVDLIWAVLLHTTEPLLGAASAIHACVAVALLVAAAEVLSVGAFLRILSWAVLVALAIAWLASGLESEVLGARPRATFRNPNQLGYFAICMASLLALALAERRLRPSAALAGFGTALALVASSQSRAALAGAAALVAILAWRAPRLVAAMMALGLLLAVAAPGVLGSAANSQRINPSGLDTDVFAATRGYQRVWEHPQFLAFGASSGGHVRFASSRDPGLEIHSSWLYVPFSYGIIGSGLALLVLAAAFHGSAWLAAATLAPAMVVGIAHMGLRFRSFWVLFAATAVVAAARRCQMQHTANGSLNR